MTDPNGYVLSALVVAWVCAFLAVKIAANWAFGPEPPDKPCPRHPNTNDCAHRRKKGDPK